MNAASEAIRRVFPDANIVSEGADDYPIRVKVIYNGKVLWEGDQRNLFRKYASARSKSQKEIEEAVRALHN